MYLNLAIGLIDYMCLYVAPIVLAFPVRHLCLRAPFAFSEIQIPGVLRTEPTPGRVAVESFGLICTWGSLTCAKISTHGRLLFLPQSGKLLFSTFPQSSLTVPQGEKKMMTSASSLGNWGVKFSVWSISCPLQRCHFEWALIGKKLTTGCDVAQGGWGIGFCVISQRPHTWNYVRIEMDMKWTFSKWSQLRRLWQCVEMLRSKKNLVFLLLSTDIKRLWQCLSFHEREKMMCLLAPQNSRQTKKKERWVSARVFWDIRVHTRKLHIVYHCHNKKKRKYEFFVFWQLGMHTRSYKSV